MTTRRRLIITALSLALAGGCVAAMNLEPTTQPALTIVTRQEWGSKPQPLDESKRHVPKLITLHHEGVLWKAGTDNAAKLRNVQSWGQREKNWPDLPYHYIIAPDGIVYEGRDWNYQPESNTNYSLEGVLNIELLGNFEDQRVSREQFTASSHRLDQRSGRGSAVVPKSRSASSSSHRAIAPPPAAAKRPRPAADPGRACAGSSP